jgi:hypothetical protein
MKIWKKIRKNNQMVIMSKMNQNLKADKTRLPNQKTLSISEINVV